MRKLLPLLLLCLLPPFTGAQTRAGAAISLVARLPGTVTLRQPVVPFLITVSGNQQRTSPVQFEVAWNLDPRETRSFRIFANYAPPTVRTPRLAVRLDDSDFRYFSEKFRVVLFNVPIGPENRQGRQTHTVELLFDTSEATLPDGDYRGSLTLTVEQQ